MRSLSVQIQPNRSPGIDMLQISAAFEEIARLCAVVEKHEFSSGEDQGPYFNFTFGTKDASTLWTLLQDRFYSRGEFGFHMRRASMAMCSSEAGWDDYLLLFHFDPAVKTDADSAL